MATPALIRRCLRAAGIPVVLACAALALTAPASSAGTARIGPHFAPVLTHGFVHAMTAQPFAAQGGGKLTYHRGPVMVGAIRAVAIFWEPPTLQDGSPGTVSADYNALLRRYLSDAGSHGLLAGASEYYEVASGVRRYATNRMTLARTVVDMSTPYPVSTCNATGTLPSQPAQNCISDAQIRHEIASVMSANGEVGGMQTVYFLFTDENEYSCYSQNECFLYPSNGGYCAYHSSFTRNGQRVLYANMPYGATPPSACTNASGYPNDPDSDIEISTTSHELEESVTDPLGNAWFDSAGYEIADKCGYTYGRFDFASHTANEFWNGHPYSVQQEFSNAANSCVRGGSLTLSSRKPVRGARLTLHGYNFTKSARLTVRLQAANDRIVTLGLAGSDTTGGFVARVTIPATTARGTAQVLVSGPHSADSDRETITVS